MESAFVIVSTTEEINQLLTQIRTICVDVNQSLMKIKMRAWEFRGGAGDGGSRQYLDAAKDLQDRAPKESDSILSVMEAILQSNQPYTRNNLNTLRSMHQQATELQDRIMAFVDFDLSDGNGLGVSSAPQRNFEPVQEAPQADYQEMHSPSVSEITPLSEMESITDVTSIADVAPTLSYAAEVTNTPPVSPATSSADPFNPDDEMDHYGCLG